MGGREMQGVVLFSNLALQIATVFALCGMLRFSLFGFPVAVHWMFWVNAALLGGGLSARTRNEMLQLLLWVVAAFVSILIHELGHALWMRRFGARVGIMLYAFGGLAMPDRGFARWRGIVVSLAGPVVQILAGLLVSRLLGLFALQPSWWVLALSFFTFVSIYWGFLNLLPIYPMDGGHILAHLLGPRRARVTYTVGMVLAVLLAVFMLTRGAIFGTLFFGLMAFENFQRMRGQQGTSLLHPQ